MPRVRIALLLLALVGSASPVLAQRQLHWDRLDVEATLEADGTLSIVETQTMVFTGDWNGGERIFNIRPDRPCGSTASCATTGEPGG